MLDCCCALLQCLLEDQWWGYITRTISTGPCALPIESLCLVTSIMNKRNMCYHHQMARCSTWAYSIAHTKSSHKPLNPPPSFLHGDNADAVLIFSLTHSLIFFLLTSSCIAQIDTSWESFIRSALCTQMRLICHWYDVSIIRQRACEVCIPIMDVTLGSFLYPRHLTISSQAISSHLFMKPPVDVFPQHPVLIHFGFALQQGIIVCDFWESETTFDI